MTIYYPIPHISFGNPSEHLPDVCVEVRRACLKDEEEEKEEGPDV